VEWLRDRNLLVVDKRYRRITERWVADALALRETGWMLQDPDNMILLLDAAYRSEQVRVLVLDDPIAALHMIVGIAVGD
jgi:hypothetical protein